MESSSLQPKLRVLEKKVSLDRQADFEMRTKKFFIYDVRGQEMPQNGVFCVFCGLSTPWGPYRREEAKFLICGVEFRGGQHLKKWIKTTHNFFPILGRNMFFFNILDFP